MVWPTSDVPTHHPGSEHIGRPQHSVVPTTITPLLPQCVQHNCATSGFFPDLLRAQYLSPNVLLPIPPTGPHLGNTQPGCSHRDDPPTHTSRFDWSSELTGAYDAGTGPLEDGIVLPLQGSDGVISGPMGPHGHHHAGALSQHKEICAGRWGLIGK